MGIKINVRRIDLNSDLGEGFGPWRMGDDASILDVITSANIACGGHAGDPATMVEALVAAHKKDVIVGAHPGFADREGFGRRLIPLTVREIEQLVVTQVGALMGAAALAGTTIRYVKPHGALGNLAAAELPAAQAIARAIRALSSDLAVLAISGTQLETASRHVGLLVFSEIFADRGYLSSGQLAPREKIGAVIHDEQAAANRLLDFIDSGNMPTLDGNLVKLQAHSICIHGDSARALDMARTIRDSLEKAGIALKPFLSGVTPVNS